MIEFRSTLQISQKVFFRCVQHSDLKHRAGLALKDEMLQTTPRSFELLKLFGVHNLVELSRDEPIDISDARIDGWFPCFWKPPVEPCITCCTNSPIMSLACSVWDSSLASRPSSRIRARRLIVRQVMLPLPQLNWFASVSVYSLDSSFNITLQARGGT